MERTKENYVTVWRSPAEVPPNLGPTVITIGVFDGVHRGHQVVLERAAKQARAAGIPLVVVTFDPNPLAVVRPEAAQPDLEPVGRRADLLQQAGADHVLVLPFDRDRANQSAAEFVDEILDRLLHARVVAVGADFRFGHRAAGDVGLLEQLGAEHDYSVVVVEPVGGPDVPRWSSTYIRERIAAGDVAGAAEALGRPFRLDGVVVRGEQRGRALGFPTANIPVRDGDLVPADGIYAGRVTRLDEGAETEPPLPAAISVGTNPTFGTAERTVEPYVLDRDDLELYGQPVAVEFIARLRDQRRFDSVDALVAQMHDDVAAARRVLSG
jgi:riboflavin kinase / FMN adenylyltransferase